MRSLETKQRFNRRRPENDRCDVPARVFPRKEDPRSAKRTKAGLPTSEQFGLLAPVRPKS